MQVQKCRLITSLKIGRTPQTTFLENFFKSKMSSSSSSPEYDSKTERLTKKDKKLLEQMNLPVFDYTKIHRERKRLYVFGAAMHGALGLVELLRPKWEGAYPRKFVHHPVRHKFVFYLDVKDIAAGHGFTLFGVKRRDQNGPVIFGCGLNRTSQLGYQAARTNAPLEQLIAPVGVPIPVQGEKPEVLAMGAGLGHSIVSIKNEGVITWGSNSLGQCGRFINQNENYFGSRFAHRIPSFRLASGDSEVVSIAARFNTTICLTRGGKVYVFGDNHKGQLGRGKIVVKTWDTSTPVAGDLGKEKVVKVATNGNSVLAVTENGNLFGWGCNETGMLIPSEVSKTIYEPVHIPLTRKIGRITDVAIGDLTTNLLNDRGNVYTWGQGPALGLGPSNVHVNTPTLIPPPLFGRHEYNPDVKITSIVAGVYNSAAINSKGDLFTWGTNTYGNLGLGDLSHQLFPFKVCLNGAALKVCIGVDHTIVLTSGGF